MSVTDRLCDMCGDPVDDGGWLSCQLCSNRDDDQDKALRARVAELEEALRDLVAVNQTWNDSVARIVSTPPGWNFSYLDRARRLLGMDVEP